MRLAAWFLGLWFTAQAYMVSALDSRYWWTPVVTVAAAPVDMHLRYHDAYFAGRRLRGQGVAVEACPWPEGTRGINGARRIAWLRGWADGGA